MKKIGTPYHLVFVFVLRHLDRVCDDSVFCFKDNVQ